MKNQTKIKWDGNTEKNSPYTVLRCRGYSHDATINIIEKKRICPTCLNELQYIETKEPELNEPDFVQTSFDVFDIYACNFKRCCTSFVHLYKDA